LVQKSTHGDCDPGNKARLEDYQNNAVNRVVESLKPETPNIKFIIIDHTTGSGKTAIMAKLIGDLCLREKSYTDSETVAKVCTISDKDDKSKFRDWMMRFYELPTCFSQTTLCASYGASMENQQRLSLQIAKSYYAAFQSCATRWKEH
jgi:Ni2+-binding GTPase involved in maturation of urease and hydrogenase